MALKKSELYSSLWASCDDLRGSMDASQYKDYVLVMLFIKYVSDKYAGQDYSPITIPEGASFKDMVALKGKPDIGDQINKKILAPLARENSLSDMPDFNDSSKLGTGKDMVDRLTSLISTFENPALDFSKNRADGDDLLGDAYEYLMRHFATESGKSKGQFYTPAEVSRVIAQVLGIRHAAITSETTVYDPTCGSGSLLLKVADEAHREKGISISIYGQEKDASTAGLARMNMFLHDYGVTAEIVPGNTLANPKFTDGDALKTFDYVVANPPFSDKRWSSGLHPNEGGKPSASGEQTAKDYGRFIGYGIPPAKQGDYAFLLHILRSIKPDGKGACILPHGVLFRGNAEGVIRKNLVQRGYIKGIIGLPANLFYGTGIPACVILLDKENAQACKGIFMIDASKGYKKDGPKNRLREQDVHRIVDTFTRQVEIPGYSRMVPVAEISDPKNDYNLNLPRYIDSTEAEDMQDIDGHLHGGIPEQDIEALKDYWRVIPSVRKVLFVSADRLGYYQLRIPATEIKAKILGHQEFTAFNELVTKSFAKWKTANMPRLNGFSKDGNPKALIEEIAEALLSTFKSTPLIDAYDMYQHLMDYWNNTMQDDCYLISAEGWRDAAKPRPIDNDKAKKTKEKHDLVLGKAKYKCELIPPALVIARYFSAEQTAIDALEAETASIQQQIEELEEENGGEDGYFEEAKTDKDKLTKASVTARLREIKKDLDAEDERKVLKQYIKLVEKKAEVEDKLTTDQEALTVALAKKYVSLTESEIKTLVVEDKWLAALASAVQTELERVSQTLTGRIRQLAERYETTLPTLESEVKTLSAKVNAHLVKMGFLI